MLTKWKQIKDWLVRDVHHARSLFIFERLLFLLFFCSGMHYLGISDILWGKNAFLTGVALEDGLINNFFLKLKYARDQIDLVLFLHLGFALLGFFNLFGRVSKIVVFVTGWMLFYAAQTAFHAGFYLSLNYMFFLILSTPNPKTSLGIYLRNLSWIGIVTQLILVYAVSSIFKWIGHTWIDGTSLYNISHWPELFNPKLGAIVQDNIWFAYLLNYAALTYQTLFPILVWFKKIKKPFLFAGILFHLSIGAVMGLPYFAIAMILGYLLFLKEDNFRKWKILNWFGFKEDR